MKIAASAFVLAIPALLGAFALSVHIADKYPLPVPAIPATNVPPITAAPWIREEPPTVYAAPPSNPPPSVILVGPYHWTIRYVKFGPFDFGRDYPKQLEIQLDPTLPRDQLVETLLHEIAHTCLFVGGGGTASMSGDPKTDDEFIEDMVPTMMQVLRDNPELVRWLEQR